jgi:hypothetical protein
MTRLTLELPEEVFAATRNDPEQFTHEMRLAAAASWYAAGRISQEIAAGIAGMDRTDFLLALARMGRDSFVVDFGDLDRDLSRE